MNPLPSLVIVDSVQTMFSTSCQGSVGSVTQIKDSTSTFVRFAKSLGSAVVLVGHVTKTGDIAGPRLLEHMVDTVLYLEGSEKADYRILRNIKNRFGSTSEMGVFTMESGGLEDVRNPSELFMSPAVISEGVEGAAVVVLMEGTRPLLAEVQCLVGEHSPLKIPKRTSDGFPLQRLQLICAVLQKRLRVDLGSREVYVNVVGGLKISEPDCDLAVAVTIISSYAGIKTKPGMSFVGEIGLGGEVRGGRGIEVKAREAAKMGFESMVGPGSAASNRMIKKEGWAVCREGEENFEKKIILPCRNIEDALKLAFGTADLSFLRKSKGVEGSSRGSGKKSKQSFRDVNSKEAEAEAGDRRNLGYRERLQEDELTGGLRDIFPVSDFKFGDE